MVLHTTNVISDIVRITRFVYIDDDISLNISMSVPNNRKQCTKL